MENCFICPSCCERYRIRFPLLLHLKTFVKTSQFSITKSDRNFLTSNLNYTGSNVSELSFTKILNWKTSSLGLYLSNDYATQNVASSSNFAFLVNAPLSFVVLGFN